MFAPNTQKGQEPSLGLSRRTVIIMAVACGIAVANLYYAQPLLGYIVQVFHSTQSAAGWIVTASQVGYAVGLVFLLPVGDMVDRRKLVLSVFALTPLIMLAAGLSATIGVLITCSLLAGLTAVVAGVLIPFAASLATDKQRGRVVGTIISGLLIGILGARTVAGVVSLVLGWRAVFYLAAVMTAILTWLLWRELPQDAPKPAMHYAEAIRSVGRLVVSEPVVRFRAVFGALAFAAFSAFWTTMAFVLSGPPFAYNAGVIGLFGLIGAGGALAASFAGRLADRGGTSWGTGLFTAVQALSFVVLWWGGQHVTAMIAGVILLDIGAQGVHVLNQNENYRVAPQARSRVNSAYMTCYFLGGAVGSAASTALYSGGGWLAVCLFGLALGLASFGVWLWERTWSRKVTP